MLSALAGVPSLFTEARVVVPAVRFRTKTSPASVSPSAKFVAKEKKDTCWPSAEMDGSRLSLSPCASLVLTETSCVVPATRSRTKMSSMRFVSPETRFDASECIATYRPLLETERPMPPDARLPWRSLLLTETRWVVPVGRYQRNASLVLFVSPETRFDACGDEDHSQTVRGKHRCPAHRVALPPAAAHRHPNGGPRRSISDEHIIGAVCISADQVRRGRREGHVSTVPRD